MAITQDFNDISYNGNGSTLDFDLATKVFATSEIDVFLTVVSTGVVTTLTEGTGTGTYAIAAISGDLDNGVRVTPDTTVDPIVPSGTQITIERIVTETQGLSLVEGGDLPSAELEDALDRGVMISQQISSNQERTPIHPVTDPSGTTYDIPSAVVRAGDVLGWDASGNVVNLSLITSGTVTVDTTQGLGITSNQIFAKVDETTTTFTGNNIAVKALGVDTAELAAGAVTTAKVSSPTGLDTNVVTGTAGASGQLAGWNADGDAVDSGFDVTDDDDLGTSDTTLPTQGNVKDYVDTFDAGSSAVTNGWQKFSSGIVMMWGTTGAIANDSFEDVTLPDGGFDTACLNVTATYNDTNVNISDTTAASITSKTVVRITAGSGAASGVFWQAIGY